MHMMQLNDRTLAVTWEEHGRGYVQVLSIDGGHLAASEESPLEVCSAAGVKRSDLNIFLTLAMVATFAATWLYTSNVRLAGVAVCAVIAIIAAGRAIRA